MLHQSAQSPIKAIIGLGNPGRQYANTRHNIGFKIVDALADSFSVSWQKKENMEQTTVKFDGKQTLLIKPQTFMNNSGQVIPYLTKQGIKPENILVVHDELELPFGEIKIRAGGSAKGHNGLKSIIQALGPEFHRLRFGIGRPENREEVPDYVLEPFAKDKSEVDKLIEKAVGAINDYILSNA
jgi:PTH1 family peptidyl-tRNA hydrolase